MIGPDDLARVVDVKCFGAAGGGVGGGIVEGGVNAAAFKEAVLTGGVLIGPDNLVRVIYAVCIGGADSGQGIVEGVEDMGWHGTGSSLIVSIAVSLDRKLKRDRTLSPVRFVSMSRPKPNCIVGIAGAEIVAAAHCRTMRAAAASETVAVMGRRRA